jgi:cytochrome oxidase Cu insertion factor (SCO1/SenC/PrrC family)
LLAGLGLSALGLIGYIAQLSAQRLATPWYMPCAATLGAACIILALWRRRTVWRVLALLLVMLLAGAEWAFVLGTRLPAYAGPVAVGRSFPGFATVRSDGTPFSERDLAGDQNSVLVFFRGRW